MCRRTDIEPLEQIFFFRKGMLEQFVQADAIGVAHEEFSVTADIHRLCHGFVDLSWSITYPQHSFYEQTDLSASYGYDRFVNILDLLTRKASHYGFDGGTNGFHNYHCVVKGIDYHERGVQPYLFFSFLEPVDIIQVARAIKEKKAVDSVYVLYFVNIGARFVMGSTKEMVVTVLVDETGHLKLLREDCLYSWMVPDVPPP